MPGRDEQTWLKGRVHAYLTYLVQAGEPVYFLKLAGSRHQRKNAPDYVVCVRGRTLMIELKHPDGTADATPGQLHELTKWSHAGAVTLVTNEIDQVKLRVEQLLGWQR